MSAWQEHPDAVGWWWCRARQQATPEMVYVQRGGGHNGGLAGVRMSAALKPKSDRRAYPVDMVDSPFEDAIWLRVEPPK